MRLKRSPFTHASQASLPLQIVCLYPSKPRKSDHLCAIALAEEIQLDLLLLAIAVLGTALAHRSPRRYY
jgi:hypothetical protein